MGPYIPPSPDNNLAYVRIIRGNLRGEQKTLCPKATKSRRTQRRHKEAIPDRVNIRLAFAHDADTILHSRAYARYAEKTDMFFPLGGSASHRVLGLQYAVRIARTLARSLALNEDLVEAITLAHGLGNSPFGMVGSRFLSKRLQSIGLGVFSQPAQAVRALSTIEQGGRGLNLTLQVLDGVLAGRCDVQDPIITPREGGRSWETLDADLTRCLRVAEAEKEVYPGTIEGCVVRAALMLSRFGSALEDGIAVGIIARDDVPDRIQTTLGKYYFDIINRVVMDIIERSYEKGHIEFSEEIFAALRELSAFIAQRIVNIPHVKEESARITRVLDELFSLFLDDLNRGDESREIYSDFIAELPESYVSTTPPGRIVSDFCAGTTDDFLVEQYTRRLVPECMTRG